MGTRSRSMLDVLPTDEEITINSGSIGVAEEEED